MNASKSGGDIYPGILATWYSWVVRFVGCLYSGTLCIDLHLHLCAFEPLNWTWGMEKICKRMRDEEIKSVNVLCSMFGNGFASKLCIGVGVR